MCLHPASPLPIPDDTAKVARRAFPRGNLLLSLRDKLGPIFDDGRFASLFPSKGQPAEAPWRLALVTLMQFREGLSDRQAADAVRARIDWKYLLGLGLGLDDPGFDHTVLCEFRGRLLGHAATERLLGRVLDAAREGGLLKARGRQRTDGTHVLAAIRVLNRLELAGETMRAALNAVAAVAPDWLRGVTPPDWHERYDRRVEDARLPEAGPRRDAYAARVGADGFRLLDALDGRGAPPDAVALPVVGLLRRVWARHFERVEAGPGGGASGGARLRPVRDLGPGDRVESPYDADARFRTKRGASWTGYMVHLTESCDEGRPRLLLHADTTPANVADAVRLSPIHEALVAKGLVPAEHLVDAAYVSAELLVAARERHGIDLVGPARPDPSWQSRDGSAFGAGDFAVDWDRRVARCPEGKESTGWAVCGKAAGGSGYVRANFRAEDCRACPSRAQCTRSRDPYQGRVLSLLCACPFPLDSGPDCRAR